MSYIVNEYVRLTTEDEFILKIMEIKSTTYKVQIVKIPAGEISPFISIHRVTTIEKPFLDERGVSLGWDSEVVRLLYL